jgi:putative oxidoreductase
VAVTVDRRDLGLLLLRAGIGAMMVYHGVPKLAGGPAKWAKLGTAVEALGIHVWPTFWGFAAGCAETFGGALLALGLVTRPAAGFLLTTMFVAAWNHLHNDGFGDATHAIDDGLVFLAFVLVGPGRYSLDARFGRL